MKNEQEMVYHRNSDCWYREVCNLESCDNCIRFMEMKFLMDNSGIPKNKQVPVLLEPGDDFESFCILADIKDDIINFVTNGKSLYITSKQTGNGKTSWAIKLLLKYFDEIWPGNGFRVRGVFVHVPTLLNRLKDFGNPLTQEYKMNLVDADLVVWDDIASTKLSEYDHSQLLSFIDSRVMNDKSNIYTGNIPNYHDLENAIGNRLASRIWRSGVVEFIGKDRR